MSLAWLFVVTVILSLLAQAEIRCDSTTSCGDGTPRRTQLKVAIIGGGPSGLAVLRAFRSLPNHPFKLTVFEKQASSGGLWNYDWRTGLGRYGEPVHGSMYRQLWSNGPKEALEFADYSFDEHFGRSLPSYPPRSVLLDYIRGRIDKSGVDSSIKFNHSVRWIAPATNAKQLNVVVYDHEADETIIEDYDHVVVCSGHFSVPNVPEFRGIESFPGRVLHAHDFRSAEEFVAKRVLLVGASYSAEDIGSQIYKVRGTISYSYRTKPMRFEWPADVTTYPLLIEIEGSKVTFKDGRSANFDVIVFCTGYLHHFPFLHSNLVLKTHNRLYPANLYKGIFSLRHPALSWIGMQDQYFTFNMFDAQAWVLRDFLLNPYLLPESFEVKYADTLQWLAAEENCSNYTHAIDFQAAYIKDLLALSDYPMTPHQVEGMAQIFKDWEEDKTRDVLTFRDKSYTSVFTGTRATHPKIPWMKQLNDGLDFDLS